MSLTLFSYIDIFLNIFHTVSYFFCELWACIFDWVDWKNGGTLRFWWCKSWKIKKAFIQVSSGDCKSSATFCLPILKSQWTKREGTIFIPLYHFHPFVHIQIFIWNSVFEMNTTCFNRTACSNQTATRWDL